MPVGDEVAPAAARMPRVSRRRRSPAADTLLAAGAGTTSSCGVAGERQAVLGGRVGSRPDAFSVRWATTWPRRRPEAVSDGEAPPKSMCTRPMVGARSSACRRAGCRSPGRSPPVRLREAANIAVRAWYTLGRTTTAEIGVWTSPLRKTRPSARVDRISSTIRRCSRATAPRRRTSRAEAERRADQCTAAGSRGLVSTTPTAERRRSAPARCSHAHLISPRRGARRRRARGARLARARQVGATSSQVSDQREAGR